MQHRAARHWKNGAQHASTIWAKHRWQHQKLLPIASHALAAPHSWRRTTPCASIASNEPNSLRWVPFPKRVRAHIANVGEPPPNSFSPCTPIHLDVMRTTVERLRYAWRWRYVVRCAKHNQWGALNVFRSKAPETSVPGDVVNEHATLEPLPMSQPVLPQLLNGTVVYKRTYPRVQE